jgi:hypothetical protein
MAVLAVALALAASFKATLAAQTHAPRVNTRWYYAVHATDPRGRPIRALLTAQVIDPLGSVHPVQFGRTTRNVTNWPFRGVFRDFITWPAEARGFTVTLRITVRARRAKRVLTYKIRPR